MREFAADIATAIVLCNTGAARLVTVPTSPSGHRAGVTHCTKTCANLCSVCSGK